MRGIEGGIFHHSMINLCVITLVPISTLHVQFCVLCRLPTKLTIRFYGWHVLSVRSYCGIVGVCCGNICLDGFPRFRHELSFFASFFVVMFIQQRQPISVQTTALCLNKSSAWAYCGREVRRTRSLHHEYLALNVSPNFPLLPFC